LTTVPSVMVSLSCGMVISKGMSCGSLWFFLRA
jgi:hypothetical protein